MFLPEDILQILKEVSIHNRVFELPVGADGPPGVMYPLEVRQETCHELSIRLEVGGVLLIVDDELIQSMTDVLEVIFSHPLIETVLDQRIWRGDIVHLIY